jgi:hypothetical protein
MGDRAYRLYRACDFRDRGTPDAEHFREKFLRQRDRIPLGTVARL